MCTWLPEREIEPSRMASTLRARAISGSDRCASLNCMAEVRETIRRVEFLASMVVSSSVMPSAKYSSLGSPERLARGRTASEAMAVCVSRSRKRAASRMRAEGKYRNGNEHKGT